ncbi:16S rRNA (guanine(527)-N(7))-methyltransferase RsmG [Variovorax sp. LG9.2]|uniref:16S rRNA (guanine(527)-N(7))-methyltransferase RsmG n=1 Tax=Variovorax sp. LG9.2 TaxID=3048626 RepID=UPI002B231D6D|nr:16S rRNA (guanine(527)-N(7))-methyltransferase RsmG [Variovorax sp. LG9.2]MEB0057502.1 16S rRNA (guanine(527)-N(7))-methyltransferase RsmG [Variovorax sp. LG9.2]
MTAVLSESALRSGAEALNVELTDAQLAQLGNYGALLMKWSKVYNLTAVRDPGGILTHHLLDSMAVVPALRRELRKRGWEKVRLLDVGSGAGLPGAVIAILCPNVDVTCLDAVAKKIAFVQQVAAELKLPNLTGLHARIEAMTDSYEVVSSRAFASLGDFVGGSANALRSDGIWLAMKGRTPDEEIKNLPAGTEVFHVEQLVVPGLDAERCIVWLRKD